MPKQPHNSTDNPEKTHGRSFDECWKECERRLKSCCWKWTGERHDTAKELLPESWADLFVATWVKAHDAWPKRAHQDHPCAWFETILKNNFLDAKREQTRHPAVSLSTSRDPRSDGEAQVSFADRLPDPITLIPGSEQWLAVEMLRDARTHVKNEMPYEFAIYERYQGPLTPADLARLYGRSVAEIEQDIAKVEAELRPFLADDTDQHTEEMLRGVFTSVKSDLPHEFALYERYKTPVTLADLAQLHNQSVAGIKQIIAAVEAELRRYLADAPDETYRVGFDNGFNAAVERLEKDAEEGKLTDGPASFRIKHFKRYYLESNPDTDQINRDVAAHFGCSAGTVTNSLKAVEPFFFERFIKELPVLFSDLIKRAKDTPNVSYTRREIMLLSEYNRRETEQGRPPIPFVQRGRPRG